MRVKEQRSESAIHDVKSNDVKSNDAKSHDANDRRDTNKGVVDNAEAENRDKANRDNVHIVDFANIISKSFGVGGITAEMKEMMLKIVSEMSDVNHPVKSCDVVGGYKGKTLLELMAMHGCRPEDGEKFEEVVRGICNRGGDINLKSGFSKSAPIYSAIGNGNSNVAYIMIKTFGSRINYESKDGNGNNFAHFILMNGYLTRPKITKLFQEDDKRSALSLLGDVIKYSPSIVNSKMIDGNTPLHIACMKRDLGAVKLLIQNGADIETLNKSGLKPCDMLKFQYPEVCKYLKQYVLFPQAFRQSHSNNKNREEIANFINDIANVSVVSRINTSDNSAKAKQAERNDMEIDVKSSTSKPATSKPATSKTRDRMLSRYKSSDRKMDKESDELRLQKNEKNSQIKSQINRKKSYARFVSEKRANQSSFVGGRF